MKKGTYDKIMALLACIFILNSITLLLSSPQRNEESAFVYRGHTQVIDRIRDGQVPSAGECGYCYHPKLYHLIAGLIKGLAGTALPVSEYFLIGLFNIGLVLGILLVAYLFLETFEGRYPAKLITLSLMGFNPLLSYLILNNSNDILCALFASISIYLIHKQARAKKNHHAAAFIFAGLAAITKGTGVVLLLAILILLVLRLLSCFRDRAERKAAIRDLAVFLAIALFVVPLLGQYVDTYLRYKDPFAMNASPVPPPNLLEDSYFAPPYRPSFISTFFTFRFRDLFRAHYNTPEVTDSFWTQLYIRANYPGTTGYRMITSTFFLVESPVLRRAVFLLGLFPLAVLLTGMYLGLRQASYGLAKDTRRYLGSLDWFFLAVALSYVFFLAYLSFRYRVIDSINPKYLLPATVPFAKIFFDGMEKTWPYGFKRKAIYALLAAHIAASILVVSLTSAFWMQNAVCYERSSVYETFTCLAIGKNGFSDCPSLGRSEDRVACSYFMGLEDSLAKAGPFEASLQGCAGLDDRYRMDCISVLGAYINDGYWKDGPQPDDFLRDAGAFYEFTKIPPDPWADIDGDALEKICQEKTFYMRACDDPLYSPS